MTTMTDDIGPRIAAVEADIRNIKEQLERLNTEIVDIRREVQAELRAMRTEHQAEIRAVNERIAQVYTRIDQTNERIDQVSERIDQTNERIDQTNERIDRVEVRIDQTNERIDRLGNKIDRVLYVILGSAATLLVGMALVAYSFGGGTGG